MAPAETAAVDAPWFQGLQNPFRESTSSGTHRAEPCTVVIFGASGDLTKRKLLPALYNLALDGLLPNPAAIVGVARRPVSHDDFRSQMREAMGQFSRRRLASAEVWDRVAAGLYYVPGEFSEQSAFVRLRESLEQIEKERGLPGNRLFYLAIPPEQIATVVKQLGAAGLVSRESRPWSRVIVEKPFGTDLASGQRLNAELGSVLREDQIYRIDHYLGKETVQNLLVFRFANGIFEPIWNQKYVDQVQITVAETVGVESRAGYFDKAGITRDIIQNHVLQLLSLVAMEPPVALDADAVRDEKVKVLRALRPIRAESVASETARAQYGAGALSGKAVPAYTSEPGVPAASATETYAAIRCYVDNWRWSGVPFYLRAGKRLARRATEISIQFKSPPHSLFRGPASSRMEPNVLAVRIQPDEGISLRFTSKVPGPSPTLQPVRMDFLYGTSFGVEPPEAYERLLLDSMVGDSTLFTRSDEVEQAWRFVTPILEGWQQLGAHGVDSYPAGSWGPRSADDLIAHDGRSWRRL
ncbi:MAG: glucose-6-phosphate dehydrogenase [Planctomycetes bacterium]|nr:glucose-6-phosphate dehydrogenase [Planctomycetota bacterium]